MQILLNLIFGGGIAASNSIALRGFNDASVALPKVWRYLPHLPPWNVGGISPQEAP